MAEVLGGAWQGWLFFFALQQYECRWVHSSEGHGCEVGGVLGKLSGTSTQHLRSDP